jgi:DNA-binding Lrp family transcriptional regulator
LKELAQLNGNCTCLTSIPKIANACDISNRQVQISTRRLIEAAYIERVGYDFVNANRAMRGTTYKILTPELDTQQSTKEKWGVMASSIPVPAFLRFCPACKRKDEECYGETYWHRLHQLPGVEVCPTHETFLENSGVGLRANRKHLQFISAEQATRSVPAQLLDVRNRDHQALLQAAQDAKRLLSRPISGISLELLYGRYLRQLVERGLATYTGSIHVKKLLAEFTTYYSPALLKLLHCELRGGDVEKSNWLLRLARPPKHAQHPIYHLLLIQFLGHTVEEFFQLPEELRPFGEGPWPCLNPVASHYEQPVIMECQLGDRLRYGKPTGKFSCECGFAYARTGPDSSPKDKLRVGKIISFGQVWETKLKRLWQDSSLSISEVAKRLGVDPLTVRRHAIRLEVSLTPL